ncbi:phosphotransferase family protein [Allokutzneria albata]|uniref:Phosphotransferase enzyme family protein n=1 Tax=Allokutzneria albata TaxID=211114 RepID=A0A1G9RY19_ALLAB|nr:phosphotransferase [Allokutzneria albata]SDM28178.1 Phosphotransferase enzyme family protein [Allokutzneria albata]
MPAKEESAVSGELLEIADALLPGVRLDSARLFRGGMHDVVLVPEVAAVRVSRRDSGTAALPRRTEVLRMIASSGLPFAVPEPLTPVTTFGERAAVAVSWVGGTALPEGQGDPEKIAPLLRAIRECPVSPELEALLHVPPTYPDGRHWGQVLIEEVIPRLPEQYRAERLRRVEEALAMPPVSAALVHGDLGGGNVHWDDNGDVVGVLDWDLALVFDPAIDAALMAWHGWENVRGAVDEETYRRARTWDSTIGVGFLVSALYTRTLDKVDVFVEHIVRELQAREGGTKTQNGCPAGSA